MKVRNPNLVGVASELQLGKNGLMLSCLNGVIRVVNTSGTFYPLQTASPVNSNDVVTKEYYDVQTVKFYDESGTLQTGVKAISLQNTTDSNGNWSVSLPSLGQTTVLNVMVSAISPASSNSKDMCNAHILTTSITTITGWASTLSGGSRQNSSAPSGVTINVMVWVK